MKAPSRRQIAAGIREITDSGDAAGAIVAAEAELARHPKSFWIMDSYIAALDLDGQTERALGLAIKTAARRVRSLSRKREAREPRALTPETRLFISGFFYSGSGAVLDYLKDFNGVIKWAPKGEVRLIKFPGGMWDLTTRLRTQKRLVEQDLLDFYLHIAGAKAVTEAPGRYTHWRMVNTASTRLLTAARTEGYLICCLECFLDVVAQWRAGILTRAKMRAAFRKGVAAALDAAATDTGAQRLAIDQMVTAWRLRLSKLTPPSTFVVVHRDPRDQFAEASEVWKKPGRQAMDAEKYVAEFRKRRLAAEKNMAMMENDLGHRIVRVSFERFVMRHAEATAELLPRIGLEPQDRTRQNYDVEASRLNIGKYRDMLTPGDAALIAEALPEYLSPDMPS